MPPHPNVYYIREQDWKAAVPGTALSDERGGMADALTGNVVIKIVPEQYDLAVILAQAHELSHTYRRLEFVWANRDLRIKQDGHFLEESYATNVEMDAGMSAARDVLGANQVAIQMDAARLWAQQDSRVSSAARDYVISYTPDSISVLRYYAAHQVTEKLLSQFEHGWAQLEHARTNGDYSLLAKSIDDRWGTGTYALLEICPAEVQSAWFMSAYLQATEPAARQALGSIIRERSQL